MDAGRPEGLVYEPELLFLAEERALLDEVERLDFREIVLHGLAARRTARHFGIDYAYESREVVPGDPLPEWLLGLRARCAELAGVPPDALVEALVQRYPPGSTIGWHRDAPMFGEVVDVSLASACRLRFQRGKPGARQTWEVLLEPRSAYVLAGSARWAWQHSIPPTKALRYSVTFRTLRRESPSGR